MTAVDEHPPGLGEPSLRRADKDDDYGFEAWSVVCTTCEREWIGEAWEACATCVKTLEAEGGGRHSGYQAVTHIAPPPPGPDAPWPDPVPLQGQRECPPFPVNALPDWMAAQCRQVGQEMQYDADLPAQLALTALSLCMSGHVEVVVNGPWVEGVNIYTATAMPASAGKSPAMKHMVGAIKALEADLIERAAQDVERREIERKILERERDDATKKGEVNQALAASDALRDKPPIVSPRLIAEDVTPEKLGMLMAEHDERMALLSTEGGLFQIMAGRYTEQSNLDLFLQAWSGDSVNQDRVGRASVSMRHARLVIGLTVQPIIVQRLADNDEFNGRGLVARFMYSIPRNTVGERDKRRRSTWSSTVAAEYDRRLTAIAYDHLAATVTRRLTLAPDALDAFQDWQQDHENRVGYNGDLEFLAEWISKMESTVCRVAALIHVAEECRGDVIGIDVMLRAITIGNYWEAHARIAGDLWGADPEVAKAVRLLRWAQKRQEAEGLDTFVIRDVMRGMRKAFPRAEAAVPVLQILTESGWIRHDGVGGIETGRRGDTAQTFTLRPPLTTESGELSPMSTMSLKTDLKDIHSFSISTGVPAPRDMGDMGDNSPDDIEVF